MAEETEAYQVRLLFDVQATSHEAAVGRIIDQLSRHGILDWTYRAMRISDGDIAHFNGDLEPVSLEYLKSLIDGQELSGTDLPDLETARGQDESE